MIEKNRQEIYPTIAFDILIFLSAYSPLFIILFIKSVAPPPGQIQILPLEANLFTSYIATTLVIAGLTSCLVVANRIRSLTKETDGDTRIKIKKSERVRGDMLNYTIPILISLLGFDYATWQSTLTLIFFLTLMFTLCRIERTSLLNPFFLLINIRLYNITYLEVGRLQERNCLAICFGKASASEEIVRIKESSGINIIY